jgi:hypothetical protein
MTVVRYLNGVDSMPFFDFLLLSNASHMMKGMITDINIKELNYVR